MAAPSLTQPECFPKAPTRGLLSMFSRPSSMVLARPNWDIVTHIHNGMSQQHPQQSSCSAWHARLSSPQAVSQGLQPSFPNSEASSPASESRSICRAIALSRMRSLRAHWPRFFQAALALAGHRAFPRLAVSCRI